MKRVCFAVFFVVCALNLNAANLSGSYVDMCSKYLKIINNKEYEIYVFNFSKMVDSIEDFKKRFPDKFETSNLGTESGYKYPYLATKHVEAPRYKVFIMAGQHGTESLSTLSALRWFENNLSSDFFEKERVQVVMLPMANPWGVDNVVRKNHNDIDTNRQFIDGSTMSLKAWVDKLVSKYGPYDLSLDIHGTLFKEGLFIVQNGSDIEFAQQALKSTSHEILSKSDSGNYPDYRGTNTNPQKYLMLAPGLSTSETLGTFKSYMESSGASTRAFTLEYSDKIDENIKIVALENLMQQMVFTMRNVD